MKKKYTTPVVEICDLKAMNILESQVGIHSKVVNQNPDDNTDDEGTFAKTALFYDKWGSNSSLWDD